MGYPWNAGEIVTAVDLNELGDMSKPIRHRRHRNGLSLGTGNVMVFGGNATGTQIENVGGITFTADSSNGYFTVPVDGAYACTIWVDPSGTMGSSFLLIGAGGSTFTQSTYGGAGPAWATLTRYLAASSTVQFTVNNGSGGALTADALQVEVMRVG